MSCASGQYLKNYKPIKVFLKQEKIDTSEDYMLQIEKVDNKTVLTDFNEFKSAPPYFDSNFKQIAFHNDKQYKKMCHTYLNDTLKRYWKKDEFLEFNFKVPKKQVTTSDSIYNDLSNQNKVYISEPMYYWSRKYLIFSYGIYNYNGGAKKLIFMKKEKGKWKIDKILSTDVYF